MNQIRGFDQTEGDNWIMSESNSVLECKPEGQPSQKQRYRLCMHGGCASDASVANLTETHDAAFSALVVKGSLPF